MDGLVLENPIVERVLQSHRAVLGPDFDGYRHHVYRVASFFNGLGPARLTSNPALPIAAAFHDLGIWVDHTFDYLEPSARLAQTYLAAQGLADVDPDLVHELIVQHHKLSRYRQTRPWAALVEQWRQADLVDVSLGTVRFGLPYRYVREVQHHLPDRGFHRRLLSLTLRELVRRPWNPLPMMRW